MLLFSTLLSIKSTMQADDFIRLIIEWNQSSPHASNIIPNIKWNGEHTIRFGNEKLWLHILELQTATEHSIAARYQKVDENGAIWTTDYVMNFKTCKMSIRLDRTYLEEAVQIDGEFSTPHFITMLIMAGYLENDGILPIGRMPIIDESLDIHDLMKVLTGDRGRKLPLVYISKKLDGTFPLDVALLASRLKGVAHVCVEGHCSLHEKAAKIVEFGPVLESLYSVAEGNVKVWYPGHERSVVYRYHETADNHKLLMEKIIRAIIQYSNIQEIDSCYTWAGVEKAQLLYELNAKHEELQRVRASQENTEELNMLLSLYDEEMQQWKQRLNVMMDEKERLADENKRLKLKLNETDGVPLLIMGEEQEFYTGEIKDMILSELSKSRELLAENCRRADIIKDVVQTNGYEELAEQRMEQLRAVMKTYDGMSKKTRKILQALGFIITEEGKHYKLTYYNDERYVVTLAKTPSDARAGKNNISFIKNKVY